MKELSTLITELVNESENLRDELELLGLKYKIIDELIGYRRSLDMSQTEFAEKIGIKQQMVSRFEKGEVDPRLSFVAKVLKGMEKDILIVSQDYKAADNLILYSNTKKSKRMVNADDVFLNNNFPKAI